MEIAAALDDLGIEPSDMVNDGTAISFRSGRLPEVMRTLGVLGEHLHHARVCFDDWGSGPEIMILMPSLSFTALYAAYLNPSSSCRPPPSSRFERAEVV